MQNKHEAVEAYTLAAIGLSQGLVKEFVSPHLTAKRAWATIGLGVLAYEAACPKGELLSEGCDRAFEGKYGLATKAAIAYTALHLMNLIPEKLDAFHQVAEYCRGK